MARARLGTLAAAAGQLASRSRWMSTGAPANAGTVNEAGGPPGFKASVMELSGQLTTHKELLALVAAATAGLTFLMSRYYKLAMGIKDVELKVKDNTIEMERRMLDLYLGLPRRLQEVPEGARRRTEGGHGGGQQGGHGAGQGGVRVPVS